MVSHYNDWSFSLLGDYSKLGKIINGSAKGGKSITENVILKSFKEDIKMINSLDCFICVARHTMNVYAKYGNIRAKETAIIHNAIEDTYITLSKDEKLQLRKKYLIEDSVKIILFAGRLDDVKGLRYIIQAFKNVLTTHPNTRLFIAGDGDFNQWMKESADCWSKIIFTGRLEKKQLFEFYSIADMGVVCSLHEEFGLVAIEMMMHELAIIVTQTGGLDEIIENGISGLKVPVITKEEKRQVDVNNLSDKMMLLLDNSAMSKELGKNGRKRFLDKFELSVFKEKKGMAGQARHDTGSYSAFFFCFPINFV